MINKITIVGAGVIGAATALTLQQRGHEVLLLDRERPCAGASFGNAGAIVNGSCVPTATPGIFFDAIKMLSQSHSPLSIRPSYLPKILPWLMRFMWQSRTSAVNNNALNLHALSQHAVPSWRIIGNQSVMAKSIAPDLDDPILNNLQNQLSLEKQQKLAERTHLGKYSLPSDLDTWSGYPAARERFYHIAKNANVKDLLVISGDSHSFWQNQLFDDNGQSMGVELGATGVTSPRSIMESLGGDIMLRFDALNTANNQEIIWSDGRHLGFIRLDVNHKSARGEYVTVSNVGSRTYNTQVLRTVDIHKEDGLLRYE